MKIDSKAIKKLAELLDETGLTEIEVADGDKALRVSKGGGIISAPVATVSADSTQPKQENISPQEQTSLSTVGTVKSPMVGTVYLQPSPDESAYVKEGEKVKKGDTLLIIEAMKVMNPIKAEKDGTVAQILVEDAQPVEFGDALIIIE